MNNDYYRFRQAYDYTAEIREYIIIIKEEPIWIPLYFYMYQD